MTPDKNQAIPVLFATHPDAMTVGTRVTRYQVIARKFENSYATDEAIVIDVLVPCHISTNPQIDRFLKRTLCVDWRVVQKLEIPAIPF